VFDITEQLAGFNFLFYLSYSWYCRVNARSRDAYTIPFNLAVNLLVEQLRIHVYNIAHSCDGLRNRTQSKETRCKWRQSQAELWLHASCHL